jgi:hypothetical protein
VARAVVEALDVVLAGLAHPAWTSRPFAVTAALFVVAELTMSTLLTADAGADADGARLDRLAVAEGARSVFADDFRLALPVVVIVRPLANEASGGSRRC